MAEYSDETLYWLKLKRDFFKRHDVRILEAQDNGKDYVLFYLKLLLESLDHQGELRFNDMIPYDEKMLSTITNTNVDIVRAAMQVLGSMGLIEVLDDKTIYLTEVQKMVGAQTKGAAKKKKQRINAEVRALLLGEGGTNVHPVSTLCPPDIRYQIEDKDKGIGNDEHPKVFHRPTIEKIEAYCNERGVTSFTAEKFFDYYEANGWMLSKDKKMKDWKATIRNWARMDAPEPPKENKWKAYDRVDEVVIDGVTQCKR